MDSRVLLNIDLEWLVLTATSHRKYYFPSTSLVPGKFHRFRPIIGQDISSIRPLLLKSFWLHPLQKIEQRECNRPEIDRFNSFKAMVDKYETDIIDSSTRIGDMGM